MLGSAAARDVSNGVRRLNLQNVTGFSRLRLVSPAVSTSIHANGPKRKQSGMASRNWRTKQQIADHFTCSYRSVGNLMRRRILPYFKLGNLVRFDLAECERIMVQTKSKSAFVR